MLNRIYRLSTLLIVIALSLYVVILNRENITVKLTPGNSITTYSGVILIAVFCLGIVCATLVALFFGLRSYFRERKLHLRERQRSSFFQLMVLARSLISSGEYEKAQELWQQLLKREPSNVVALLELARSIEEVGDFKEALKIIDKARAADTTNIEVLFSAVRLNLALGNKTAAIDNLALILYHHPCQRAARLARDLSEDLERFEDALEYQTQLEKLGGEKEESLDHIARIRFKKLVRDYSGQTEVLRTELRTFVKRENQCVPALIKLAELEQDSTELDSAAFYLVKAANLSCDQNIWKTLIELWRDEKKPEKALAAARAATKECMGLARLHAELNLIRLQVDFNMHEDAQAGLEQFPAIIKKQDLLITPEIAQTFLMLKVACFYAQGQTQKGSHILRLLLDSEEGELHKIVTQTEETSSPSNSIALGI